MHKIYSGKRKTSSASVILKKQNSEKKEFLVNKISIEKYLVDSSYIARAKAPLSFIKEKFNIYCTAKGGGKSSQADSISLGLSRAIQSELPESRKVLKSNKLLTRDSRCVERKKPGQPKARKKFQFTKR